MSMTNGSNPRPSNDLVESGPANLPEGFLSPNASLAVSLASAEIDQQITTARAYPRSIARAVDNILTLATLDQETAEECVYALPRAGKAIKGPSVRLAEIVASQYGNCRIGARVVHVDRFEKYVEAESVFHDLETNVAWTSRVRRRISTSSKGGREGRLFDDDMIIVTGNAACAIAKRNAILGGVPRGIWRRAYAAVESVIAGDIKTLGERRDRAMKAFAAFGVSPERVFEAIEVEGLDDIKLEHMGTLTGMHAALKSGEATVEEMFPIKAVRPVGERPKTTADALDALEGKAPAPVAAAPAPVDAESSGGDIGISVAASAASGTAGGGAPDDAAGATRGSTPAGFHLSRPEHQGSEVAPAQIVPQTERELSAKERTEQAIAAKRAREVAKAAPSAEAIRDVSVEDDDDRALRADLSAQGVAIAERGTADLKDWRDGLTEHEASLLSPSILRTWASMAAQADKKLRG